MNIENSILKNAFSAAVKLIEPYVRRGDSYQSLKEGQLGRLNDEFHAFIGGYVDNIYYSPEFIVVTKANFQQIETHTFSLQVIYKHIKQHSVVAIQKSLF